MSIHTRLYQFLVISEPYPVRLTLVQTYLATAIPDMNKRLHQKVTMLWTSDKCRLHGSVICFPMIYVLFTVNMPCLLHKIFETNIFLRTPTFLYPHLGQPAPLI